MTKEEIEIAKSFDRITFLPGSWNKRFAQGVKSQAILRPGDELSGKQKEWMYRILYTFRRQIPDVYEKYKFNEWCQKAKNREI